MVAQCNIHLVSDERYRLQPVREVRAIDERVKQGELADATNLAKKTAAAVDKARARISELEQRIAAARRPEATSTAIELRERYLARLRRALDEAKTQLAHAIVAHEAKTSVVDAARVRLVRARADKEVVDRHHAKWREMQAKLAERRAD